MPSPSTVLASHTKNSSVTMGITQQVATMTAKASIMRLRTFFADSMNDFAPSVTVWTALPAASTTSLATLDASAARSLTQPRKLSRTFLSSWVCSLASGSGVASSALGSSMGDSSGADATAAVTVSTSAL